MVMSDKCPTCKGPVKPYVDTTFIGRYRSTAAEQLKEQKKVEALCIEELLEAEEQLTATNAVVEATKKFWKRGGITQQRFADIVVPKLIAFHKLQGGDGDE